MTIILQISLCLLYIIAFIFLFAKLNKQQASPVKTSWIGAAFVAKVLAGFVYGYIYARYFTVSDSWFLFEESLKEYHTLLLNPIDFFQLDVKMENAHNLFSTTHGATWKNLDDNLFIKLVGILNLFSGGNYYITSLLFNIFSFWGLYQIFIVATTYFPKNSIWAFLLVFFMPSCLFWNSGLLKDGLIVFFTGALVRAMSYIVMRKYMALSIATALLSVLFLLMFRVLNGLIIIPALLGWLLSGKNPTKTLTYFLVIYGVGVVAFFLTAYLPIGYNLPWLIAERQHEFLNQTGGSLLPIDRLEPTILSYLQILPQAVGNVFFRPWITDIKGPFQLISFFEMLFSMFFIIWAVLKRRPELKKITTSPFLLFLLSLALSTMLIIGFMVPFSGSIVRYKSFYSMLFLLALLLPILKIKIKDNII